ncbi:class I SAM-dependent DNA methyltransferase [Lysinibacillus sp. NPDC098008]|uniref:HsdM family class I SAM-dependent methyltransferase n=1 Tax=Lysinibacillus sp. NPDC098008 TaxID=3364146 RepID=UPI0038298D60
MKKYINETKTEDLLVEQLKENGFNNDLIEKRLIKNPEIRKLLSKASKKLGSENAGYPDIYTPLGIRGDFILIAECKGDINKHETNDYSNPQNYAVDGIVHYASFLSKEYNVIALGVSGMTNDELKISTFFFPKGEKSSDYNSLKLDINTVISPENYLNACIYSHSFKHAKMLELNKLSRELHNYMRDYAKLAENEKPLLIGAVILALLDRPFEASYAVTENDQSLAELLEQALNRVFRLAKFDINEDKRTKLEAVFNFITVHPELTKNTQDLNSRVLFNLVKKVDQEILPIIRTYNELDLVGDFYREFLRYTGGDKKSLGIVLTPPHITELFAELAQITVNDIVLDTCTGTGSFLISSYNYMKSQAKGDPAVINAIKGQIIGVEQQPQMFALLAINMLLRDIPLTNMYADNSFDIKAQLALKNATFGPQNPPYAQKGEGLSELDYFKGLTDCLVVNGNAITIIPLSCIISDEFKSIKEKLLETHTLEAVLSMPDDLFYPVGTITCVMVFKIGTPHPARHKTWFAYCKDDGFVKTKNAGRIDLDNKWTDIKEMWLESFSDRTEVPGFSVLQRVTAKDEWIAEAYIETDYSKLTVKNFEEEVKKYALFNVVNSLDADLENEEEN